MASVHGTRLGFAFLLLAASAGEAAGGGLFLAPRAVRPLARGGAYVAGADDVNALSYNPAGIGEAPNSALFDMGLPIHSTTFTRSGGLPSVEGQGFGIPSPSVGVVHDLGLIEGLRFGLGVFFDSPMLQNWPSNLEDGSPAPQRYAIENFRGSGFGKLALGAAYSLGEMVTVGASFHLLSGRFVAQMAVSACDGVICTQPENTDYDATMRMTIGSFFIPGAQLGLIVKPVSILRVGLAWESAYNFNEAAELSMRMPTAPMFADASVFPEVPTAMVKMTIPMQLRGGVELRPDPFLRVEVAFDWEKWSDHARIDLEPEGVGMDDVLMLGRYQLQAMSIDRSFHDTWSVRLGAEYAPPLGQRPLTVRAGVAYEPSAVPDETLTAMTVDLDKLIVGVGAGYALGSYQIELMYAYVWMRPRTIGDSQSLQMNPTRPAWDRRTAVGNGDYRSTAHIVGAGASYRFR
jgi:long-chain fatty acid transport protein